MRRRIEPFPGKLWLRGHQAGDTIYLSGQVGLDADGKIVGDDIRSQTRQAYQNIQTLLHAAGSSLRDIVRLTLFFKAPADHDGYREVRETFFLNDPPPATAVIVTGLLMPELLIEIDVIAVLGGD